jgi:hypothetical protein
MSPDIDWEDDFHHWYDTHHIPVRLAVPGFLGAQRYLDLDRPNYLAIYEIESPEVLNSEDYEKVRAQPNAKTAWMLSNVQNYSRYLGAEIGEMRRKEGTGDEVLDADYIYAVFFSVPDDRAEEFNSWYEDEHVPMLLKGEGWLGVRRFEIYDGEPQPWTHLALHYLADQSAMDTPEHAAARETDWRKKLAEEDWFQPSARLFEVFGERFEREGE